MLEGENTKLVAGLAQAEMDRQKLVQEFVPDVVKTLHMSMKYQKSLGSYRPMLHRWAPRHGKINIGRSLLSNILSSQKVVDSYRLPMDDLLKISPDVPSPTTNAETGPSGNIAFQ
ncbi:hypothetical protein Tco_1333468 [Tanacetum coccineum]